MSLRDLVKGSDGIHSRSLSQGQSQYRSPALKSLNSMRARSSIASALAVSAGLLVFFLALPYYTTSSSSASWPSNKSGEIHHSSKAASRTWEDELKSALGVTQYNATNVQRGYHPLAKDKKLPWTVFTSYPRSGNTHLRNLVELSSGFYTSSIVCDDVELKEYFPAECDADNRFMLKAHWPVFQHEPGVEESKEYLDWWKQFDRVIWVQRNPFDAIFSLWNLMRFIEAGAAKHEGRVTLPSGKLTWEDNRFQVFELTYMYRQHFMYWRRVPLPTHKVRYEDLLGSASVPTLMGILNFLLPVDELPPLSAVLCADEGSTAYKGGKNAPLYAYEKFDEKLQEHILRELQQPWCAGGYDAMLKKKHGIQPVICQDIPTLSGNPRD